MKTERAQFYPKISGKILETFEIVIYMKITRTQLRGIIVEELSLLQEAEDPKEAKLRVALIEISKFAKKKIREAGHFIRYPEGTLQFGHAEIIATFEEHPGAEITIKLLPTHTPV